MVWTDSKFRFAVASAAGLIGVIATVAACSSAPTAGDTAAPSLGASAQPAQSSGSNPSNGGARWTYLDQGGPLQGYGWSRCPGTVTVSADTTHLDPAAGERVRSALRSVGALWTAASGLKFVSAGSEALRFDAASKTLVPVNGPFKENHIYLAAEPEVEAPRLDGGVVGLGTPILIREAAKQFVGGEAVFEAEYVNSRSKQELIHLFTHEIGHILGLGHSPDAGNIMYATVTNQTVLGPGDIAGIAAVMRPCPT